MFRLPIVVAAIGVAVSLSFSFGPASISSAHAFGSNPAPKPCAKFKRGTKSWKKCRRRNGLSTSALKQTEEALTLGYALAMNGQYGKALKFLRSVEASNDPRVLTYIGFSERKLGRVDLAMTYYERAIALAPENIATLSYMGEAHLQLGDVASAQRLLAKIASLCKGPCREHVALDKAIAGYLIQG